MTAWIKLGNRYYKKDGDKILKSVLHEDTNEYVECGEWHVDDFIDHDVSFDGNTEEKYNQIKTELGI